MGVIQSQRKKLIQNFLASTKENVLDARAIYYFEKPFEKVAKPA